MKIIHKIIIFISIVFVLTTSVFASDISIIEKNTIALEESENTARVEESEWYYMYINGVKHKRLWSITYGRWLTDWIPCE